MDNVRSRRPDGRMDDGSLNELNEEKKNSNERLNSSWRKKKNCILIYI